MKQNRTSFRISASPHFSDVLCPIHRNYMIELLNGWFEKIWWCNECKKPYQLELHALRKWNQEAVDKQLSSLPNPKEESNLLSEKR